MKNFITKTEFMNWEKCPDSYWLKKYHPEKYSIKTEETLRLLADGNRTDRLARKIFENGILVNRNDPEAMKAQSKKLTETRDVIYQPCAIDETLRITAIADILKRNSKTGKWDIFEVKNSTSLKDEYLTDLAFQYLSFMNDDWDLGEAYILTLNTDFRKDGPIDPRKFFKAHKLTTEVKHRIKTIPHEVNQAFLKLDEPEPTTCECITKPKTKRCDNFNHFYGEVIDGETKPLEIFQLSLRGVTNKGFHEQLVKAGIKTIKDIPESMIPKTQTKAYNTWLVHQNSNPIIKKNEIRKIIDSYSYPLHFLDYETLGMRAIPFWDGLKPFHKTVFQYSIDIVETPEDLLNGVYTHKEYLHKENTLPSLKIIENLKNDILPKGSIITWNKQFEMGRHKELAEEHQEFQEFLFELNSRIVDLMEVFNKGYWLDKDFEGSSSIKKVLTVLAPELSYDELEISNGGDATHLWPLAVILEEELPNNLNKNSIFESLEKYCALDTYAMIRILQVIHERTK